MNKRPGPAWTIPLSIPNLSALEAEYVAEAIASGWISGTGPAIRAFETALVQRFNRQHAVAVASGTAAVELALRALGVQAGDEVIVPSLTFASPAMCVLAVGAQPVIVDICPECWTISTVAVQRAITTRTKAIIAVDVLGHAADYDRLESYGIPVIEDAAEAHGGRYKGFEVGSLGLLSAFSFHANKAITTGEGGAVLTDSPELADRMRLIANHGMTSNRPYTHEVVGRNFRMTNVTAALGLAQLERWQELIDGRRRIADAYRERLRGLPCSERPIADWATYSCWLYTVEVNRRSDVIDSLRAEGIDARAIWPSLSRQPVFAPWARPTPVAERIAGRALWLPTYTQLSSTELDFVVEALHRALRPT